MRGPALRHPFSTPEPARSNGCFLPTVAVSAHARPCCRFSHGVSSPSQAGVRATLVVLAKGVGFPCTKSSMDAGSWVIFERMNCGSSWSPTAAVLASAPLVPEPACRSAGKLKPAVCAKASGPRAGGFFARRVGRTRSRAASGLKRLYAQSRGDRASSAAPSRVHYAKSHGSPRRRLRDINHRAASEQSASTTEKGSLARERQPSVPASGAHDESLASDHRARRRRLWRDAGGHGGAAPRVSRHLSPDRSNRLPRCESLVAL